MELWKACARPQPHLIYSSGEIEQLYHLRDGGKAKLLELVLVPNNQTLKNSAGALFTAGLHGAQRVVRFAQKLQFTFDLVVVIRFIVNVAVRRKY